MMDIDDDINPTGGTMFTATSHVVGGYDMGGFSIMVTRKPSRFQRWMIERCFGWIWFDND